jgi:ketosteroid isomerase-like protein
MKACAIFFSLAALVLVLSSAALAQQQSADEQAVWKLEHAYWEYVKALDLENYKKLWHPNFVGWPADSPKPAGKDQITDWIKAYTAKGLHLQSYSLEPAASQATENVVVVHYWLTYRWVDKDGKGEPRTNKITHTWIRTPSGLQIIAGMAAPATKPEK